MSHRGVGRRGMTLFRGKFLHVSRINVSLPVRLSERLTEEAHAAKMKKSDYISELLMTMERRVLVDVNTTERIKTLAERDGISFDVMADKILKLGLARLGV